MEEGGLLQERLLAELLQSLAQRALVGDGHAQVVAHVDGEAGAWSAGVEFGMLRQGEGAAVGREQGVVGYRQTHDGVDQSLGLVGEGAVQCGECGPAALGGGAAHLHLHLLVEGGQQVHTVFLGVLCRLDDGEVGVQFIGLAVVGGHFG